MVDTNQYVIGLDFGTDSVRALLVDAANGKAIASEVHWYERWKDGQFCNPSINQYRQHPSDHLEGIQATITGVLNASKVKPSSVKGICVDTTGSSPIAVDKIGRPLCFTPGFEENPNAMVILWKDHTSVKEAEEITQLAKTWGGDDFTKFEGGIYSSEWFWSKILHVNRVDNEVKKAAFSWMEHCDLMTYILVGSPDLQSFKRSRCASGHKAMWHEQWAGLPADEYLIQLDEEFPKLKSQLYAKTYTSDQSAGSLCKAWAEKLGLSEDTTIAVGTFDAHAGAVGAEITENTLVRVMGTSTCDIIVAEPEIIGSKAVRGICGQVDGSVIPGMIGLEAGQSAFGDVLAWFTNVLSWPLDNLLEHQDNISIDDIDRIKNQLLVQLTEDARHIPISESMPIALDWINGRRTPDANQNLKSGIVNLNLSTQAPHIFKALVESICFGSKMIVDRFREEGIQIDQVVGIGGVAKKSSYIMQTLADVLNMPIKIVNSEQAPALGAAMYAAAASGIYETMQDAILAMGNGFEKTYFPDQTKVGLYQEHFKTYQTLGNFVENNINHH